MSKLLIFLLILLGIFACIAILPGAREVVGKTLYDYMVIPVSNAFAGLVTVVSTNPVWQMWGYPITFGAGCFITFMLFVVVKPWNWFKAKAKQIIPYQHQAPASPQIIQTQPAAVQATPVPIEEKKVEQEASA